MLSWLWLTLLSRNIYVHNVDLCNVINHSRRRCFVFGRYGTVQLQQTHHVTGTFTGYLLDLLRFTLNCQQISIHLRDTNINTSNYQHFTRKFKMWKLYNQLATVYINSFDCAWNKELNSLNWTIHQYIQYVLADEKISTWHSHSHCCRTRTLKYD